MYLFSCTLVVSISIVITLLVIFNILTLGHPVCLGWVYHFVFAIYFVADGFYFYVVAVIVYFCCFSYFSQRFFVFVLYFPYIFLECGVIRIFSVVERCLVVIVQYCFLKFPSADPRYTLSELTVAKAMHLYIMSLAWQLPSSGQPFLFLHLHSSFCVIFSLVAFLL